MDAQSGFIFSFHRLHMQVRGFYFPFVGSKLQNYIHVVHLHCGWNKLKNRGHNNPSHLFFLENPTFVSERAR